MAIDYWPQLLGGLAGEKEKRLPPLGLLLTTDRHNMGRGGSRLGPGKREALVCFANEEGERRLLNGNAISMS